jgi:hypothetical protein
MYIRGRFGKSCPTSGIGYGCSSLSPEL